jgi:hypothetical protein
MTKNIYSALKKKKQAEVTISTKPTKAKPAKAKIHKAKVQQPQQQQQQIQLSTSADVNRIKITCISRGRAVQVYNLPSNAYASWQRSTFEQKFNYLLQQTNARAFNNDPSAIQAILFQVIQIIDSMFAQAAQQAQQQAQQVQKRI